MRFGIKILYICVNSINTDRCPIETAVFHAVADSYLYVFAVRIAVKRRRMPLGKNG